MQLNIHMKLPEFLLGSFVYQLLSVFLSISNLRDQSWKIKVTQSLHLHTVQIVLQLYTTVNVNWDDENIHIESKNLMSQAFACVGLSCWMICNMCLCIFSKIKIKHSC